MQRMHGVVQSKGGRVVVGALIQVFLTGTSTPATIYSNKAGTQEVTQLLSDNEGEWSFYAANGRYDIKTVINGRVDGQLIDVLLHDQADVPAASVDASVLADITAIKADITTLKGDQSNLSAQVQVVDSKTKDFDNAHGTEIVKGNWADGRVAPVAELADADGSAMIGHGDATLGSVVTANSSSISTLLTDMSAAKTDLVNVNSDLDALELADYAALRAYTGTRKNAYIVAQSSAGMFLRDDADTAVLATPVNAAFTLTSGSLAAATYSYRISAIDAFGETLGSTATTIAVPAKLATPVNAAFSVAPGSLAAATYYYRVSAINAVGETLASTETSIAVPAPLATPSNTAFSTAITGGTLAAGTYHYRVSAINAVGETLASTSTSIASANLAAPVANAPSTAITGGSLAGATYYYKVSALGTQGETLGSNEVSVASANLAAPTANAPSTATTGGSLAAATYYYKVTALGASGETIGSNEVSIATTGTTSTVTVTWGAITGATGYRVYRGTTTGGQNVYYAPGNVTTFTDTGAANTAGTVPASNTAVSSTNTNTITWGAVTGATGYRVYRGTAAGGENVYYAPGNVTTYTDTGAASTAGSPPASNTATTNTNTVTVNWGAVTGATGYKIYGRTSGGHLFIATVGNVTAYIDTGSVTPAGALPASNTTSGGVVVNWGAVTGATGYKVYGRSTGAQLLIASVGAVTTYTDTGSVTPAGALPASNTTSGGVVLNWGAVANATGYKVYGRIAGSELFMAQLGTVTTYTDGGTVTPAGALPTGYKKDNSYTVIESTNGKRWKRDGFIASGTGAIARMAQDKLRDVVSVKDFGAKGDNIADDTAAFQAAINSGNPLFIPSGTYRIGDLTGMNRSSFTMIGAGSGNTTLKYIGTGTSAFKIDAFASGSGSAPFLQNIFLDGFTVEGNTNVKSIINLQGLARSEFSDINVLNSFHGTSGDPGIGFLFSGVMLSKLDRLMCSQDRQAMTSAPYEGFRFQPGTRAGVNVGNSSNLLILNCYAEGNETAAGINVGMKLAGADQLVFHGGSPESCYVYGMTIDTNSRMNTFIGVGFENLNSTADFIDGGIANRFTNCYGSQKVILQGRQAVIEGGFYERIQVDAGAKENTIRNVVVNNWATGAGGFINGDPSTRWQGIYDQDQAKFIYPHGDRTGITVGASPFTWANNTGKYVEVVIQSGTATQIRILRGSDSWINPVAIPGRHLLAPSDSIEVSYSSAVGMSYVPHNGF